MTWRLIHADCIEAMQDMDESSVDAVVTDPPYGLRFMGKAWDVFDIESEAARLRKNGPSQAQRASGRVRAKSGPAEAAGTYDRTLAGQHGFQQEAYRWGVAMLRVLKPGGHLLIFGGTRTYHRLTCALEDAGFEIRDCLAWLYGSGFPKSLDVSKAIDKAAVCEIHGIARCTICGPVRREVVGHYTMPLDSTAPGYDPGNRMVGWDTNAASDDGPSRPITAPATPEAQQWQGWGTALKPAFEPVVLARKPLAGTVAANVLEHGTGALNIDGTRIGMADDDPGKANYHQNRATSGPYPVDGTLYKLGMDEVSTAEHPLGRWPANVILDAEAAAMLDEQSGELGKITGGRPGAKAAGRFGEFKGLDRPVIQYPDDTGGASRFFYVPKADREERNRGLEHRAAEIRDSAIRRADQGVARSSGTYLNATQNHHPTVKPVELMQWLCRLITPPHGIILDPFTGSGSTGIAALREGFDFVGIEREAEYVEIARDRIIGDAPLFNISSEVLAGGEGE